MKKLIVALGASALLMGTSALAVEPVEKENNAAVVVNKKTDVWGCQTIGSIGYDGYLFTEEYHAVLTSSDNSKLVCHFDIPEGDEPEKIFKSKGWDCSYHIEGTSTVVSTTDSKFVATPGGQATLECSFKGINLEAI